MDRKFVIFTDAGGDFTKEQRERYGIEMPAESNIVWPDKTCKIADIDWETIDPDSYYRMMKKGGNLFETAFPTPEVITKRMEEYVSQGLDVFCVTISSTMSGGFSAFSICANEVMSRYPDRKIHVVDSLRYGGAITLICMEISRCREKGMSFDETKEYIDERRLWIHQCGVMDDLFFLAKKGRIPKMTAFMGNMISVKPMADLCNETGMSCVLGKAKGYKNFFKACPKFVRGTIGNPDGKLMVVSHSLRSEEAKKLYEVMKIEFPTANLEFVVMGQATGANVGPGLCAVFYMGDKRVSPNCDEERAVMEKALGK